MSDDNKWAYEVKLFGIPPLTYKLTEGYTACAYPRSHYDKQNACVHIQQHGKLFAIAIFTDPRVTKIPKSKRDQVAKQLYTLWMMRYGN